MTIQFLLKEMVKDLTMVFRGYRLINQRDNIVSLNIYPYNLPEKKEDEDEDHFPYIIIMPQTGKLDLDNEGVITTLTIGVYDESENKQGFADILNIIEKYKNHLIYERLIGGYEVQYPIIWEMQDEDTHPAYYGGMEIAWKLKPMESKEEGYI